MLGGEASTMRLSSSSTWSDGRFDRRRRGGSAGLRYGRLRERPSQEKKLMMQSSGRASRDVSIPTYLKGCFDFSDDRQLPTSRPGSLHGARYLRDGEASRACDL